MMKLLMDWRTFAFRDAIKSPTNNLLTDGLLLPTSKYSVRSSKSGRHKGTSNGGYWGIYIYLQPWDLSCSL